MKSRIPIFIPSRGDIERAHTIRLLNQEGIKHTVVLHNKKTLREFSKHHFQYSTLVHNNTDCLVDSRNWILENLVDEDEWYIGMDDNIQRFTMVHPDYRGDSNDTTAKPPRGFESWRRVYNIKVSPELWIKHFHRLIEKADRQGIRYCGVATMENPYFRAKRYSNYRFVKTKVYGLKNAEDLRFENKLGHDSFMSALCVALYGKVLVDSFMHYHAKMYEGGGLGSSREDRDRKGLTKYLKRTVKRFSGLVVLGRGKNTALKFRLNRENSVEKWRSENGYA